MSPIGHPVVRDPLWPRSIGLTHLMPLLLCLLAPVAACSTGASSSTRDETLARLRDRIEEHRNSFAEDEEPENELTSQALEGTDQPAVVLLPPRYGGALPDGDPMVLGVFPLRTHRDPIIDGDTVAVDGLDASMRMVCLDAEEIFHGNNELQERAYTDFEDYLRLIYAEADTSIPKFSTPMGEVAREFARAFFAGDTEVRLEYDNLNRVRDYFDRYLVYVFALRDGVWINYNLESVRAGMSPYFDKYGYSDRFHAEFMEAEQEAREAGRGIWDPTLPHYPDYPARRTWWDRRAEAIRHFRETYGTRTDYFELTNEAHWRRLSEVEGQTITVFATIADFHFDWTPQRILLGHRVTDDFALIGFDAGVFEPYRMEQYTGEYVYVRGRLAFYEGHPQFVVDQGVEAWVEP